MDFNDVCDMCQQVLFLNTNEAIAHTSNIFEFDISGVTFTYDNVVKGFYIYLREMIFENPVNTTGNSVTVYCNLNLTSFNTHTVNWNDAELQWLAPAKSLGMIPLTISIPRNLSGVVAYQSTLYQPYYVMGNLPDTLTLALIDDDTNPYVVANGTNVMFEIWVKPLYEPNLLLV